MQHSFTSLHCIQGPDQHTSYKLILMFQALLSEAFTQLQQSWPLWLQGLRSRCTEVVHLCSSALVTCEGFLHPRAVPHRPHVAAETTTSSALTLSMPTFWQPYRTDSTLSLPVSTAETPPQSESLPESAHTMQPNGAPASEAGQLAESNSPHKAQLLSPGSLQAAPVSKAAAGSAAPADQPGPAHGLVRQRPPQPSAATAEHVLNQSRESQSLTAVQPSVDAAISKAPLYLAASSHARALNPGFKAVADAWQLQLSAPQPSVPAVNAIGAEEVFKEAADESDMEIPEIDSGSSETES